MVTQSLYTFNQKATQKSYEYLIKIKWSLIFFFYWNIILLYWLRRKIVFKICNFLTHGKYLFLIGIFPTWLFTILIFVCANKWKSCVPKNFSLFCSFFKMSIKVLRQIICICFFQWVTYTQKCYNVYKQVHKDM